MFDFLRIMRMFGFLELMLLREKLAELEHSQWIAWAGALEQSEELSPERIERWHKLYGSYDSLTEEQQVPDRQWADRVLAIIVTEHNRILNERTLELKEIGAKLKITSP